MRFLTVFYKTKIIIICTLTIVLGACSLSDMENQSFNLYVHEEVEWNFLIYMAADNNLERFGIQNLKALQTIGSSENVNILVLFDRSGGYDRTEGNWSDTRLFFVSKTPQNMNDDCILECGELDMTSANNLYTFLETVNQYFPAKHTVLDLWSHGRGVYPDGIIFRSVIEDYTTGYGAVNMMSIHNLAECIKKYEKEYNKRIDIFMFDACDMQMIEICYQLRDLTDFVIGSETSVPGAGSDYESIATFLNNNNIFSSRELACFLVNAVSTASVDYSYSVIDTNLLDIFVVQFNRWCAELMSKLPACYDEIIGKRAAMATVESAYPEFIDLYEFISAFDEFEEKNGLMRMLLNLIVCNNSTGEFKNKTKGLSINFPYKENDIAFYSKQDSCYKRLDFYEDSLFDEFLIKLWNEQACKN